MPADPREDSEGSHNSNAIGVTSDPPLRLKGVRAWTSSRRSTLPVVARFDPFPVEHRVFGAVGIGQKTDGASLSPARAARQHTQYVPATAPGG